MKEFFFILTFHIFGLISGQNVNYKKSIDSLLTSFQQNNAFSGEILIQKDGETVYKGDFNSFKTSDKYRVGSITKIFTATIIFQLIEEGKLSLDTKLSKYYLDIKNANEITIGNLLNHTSGIYNYLEWDDYYVSKEQKFTKSQMLDLIEKGKPDFKPGKDFAYSNSGYLLLGYIIEDITGESFVSNLNNRIINKCDLKNTFYENDIVEYTKRNSSYFFDGEKWTKSTETHPSFTLMAGALVSNTEDIAKFMEVLFKLKLVSAESLNQMGAINQGGFGHGFQYTPFYDLHGFGHSGHIDDFSAFTTYFPKENLSISVLSNGGRFKLNDVVMAIMSKLYNKPYINPDFTTYKSKISSDTKKFTGIYKAKLASLITVGVFQISEAANGFLFLSMYEEGKNDGNEEKVLMERKGENKYFARKNNAEFDFEIDKNGKVTGMKLSQNKQSINCKKVK